MWSLIEVSVEPKTKADQEKLGVALTTLQAEDPGFSVSTDPESGQTVLGGPSELHLDTKIDILRRTYGVDVNIGAPQVAYRETIRRKTEIDYTHKRQGGGSGQFARIMLVFEPTKAGQGYSFESKVAYGNVPEEFIPGVEKALSEAKENGLLAGFPVIDFKATLIDGAYHDLDSSVLAFEIAARAAFRELRHQAEPILLEPIMKIEVMTPEDDVVEVIADLNLRRGQIQAAEPRDDAQAISAFVPLANMFGYAGALRGMTQGRARFTMQYDHYAPVLLPPPDDDPRFPPAMAMRA
jgi:elongation factor G